MSMMPNELVAYSNPPDLMGVDYPPLTAPHAANSNPSPGLQAHNQMVVMSMMPNEPAPYSSPPDLLDEYPPPLTPHMNSYPSPDLLVPVLPPSMPAPHQESQETVAISPDRTLSYPADEDASFHQGLQTEEQEAGYTVCPLSIPSHDPTVVSKEEARVKQMQKQKNRRNLHQAAVATTGAVVFGILLGGVGALLVPVGVAARRGIHKIKKRKQEKMIFQRSVVDTKVRHRSFA